jgi:hypothetical protein
MTITFYSSASLPASPPGTNTSATPAVTPPASMTSGQMVFFVAWTRDSAGVSFAISQAGGQSWEALSPIAQNTDITAGAFWCRFNGTWSADPSIAVTGGTSPYSAHMHVFASDSGQWSVHNALVESNEIAGSPVTITGQATSVDSTVQIAGWFFPLQTACGSATGGSGWTSGGSGHIADVINTSGSDTTGSFAYRILTATSAAVNTNKTTAPTSAGVGLIVTFAEDAAVATVLDPLGAAGFFGL